jgi:predicted RNase H-like nuclease
MTTMRILGADLPRESMESVVVLLDDAGRVATVRHLASQSEVVATVTELAGDEPFLLAVDVPVVVPTRPARGRPVETVVRRRVGFRVAAGGRSALTAEPRGVAGEALLAGLAAAGHATLPYPDRDRRRSGLAEIHPGLVLKSLAWQSSELASAPEQVRERLFRAYELPAYRSDAVRGRSSWAERAAALDLALRSLGPAPGYDLAPVRAELGRLETDDDVERAGALLDAVLIAGTARRYLEAPEACLFLGDREGGYTILPADPFVRRIAARDTRSSRTGLFPQASLRQQLGAHAKLRSVDLLEMPGRPQRLEATFDERPRYEFDNVDEMLWWKHCRHLSGPPLPTDGLHELAVTLDGDREAAPLHLIRSRHRTLSFRFEPPAAWRGHLPTRDGRTYSFRVSRAVYDTGTASD